MLRTAVLAFAVVTVAGFAGTEDDGDDGGDDGGSESNIPGLTRFLEKKLFVTSAFSACAAHNASNRLARTASAHASLLLCTPPS
jgi:hypothetical protein